MRTHLPIFAFLFLSLFLPLSLRAADPVELDKRPIELDWAGRTQSECVPFLDFESDFTWTCECENAAATFQRSVHQPIWGKSAACLTFRALNSEGKTSIHVRPPKPIPMPREPFDSVSCWIFSYSWGRGANADLRFPIPSLSLCFLADGQPVEIPFRQIDWRNWYLVQLRLSPEQAARLNGPNVFFDGFRVTGGSQTFDREVYFDDLAFFTEKLNPLKPAVHQAFGPDPDLDPKFTFPTRPETIIPPSAAPGSKNSLEALNSVETPNASETPNTSETSNTSETLSPVKNAAFRFTYAGSDGRLEIRFTPETGTWSDLTASWNGGAEFHPLANGGVTEIVNARKAPEKVEKAEILNVQQDGETLKIQTKIHSKTASAMVNYALRLVGKTLVLETSCDAPDAARISFGRAEGMNQPQAILVPYWTGGQGYSARRPAVIAFENRPGETCFLAGEVDWYSSAASFCSSAHGVDGSSAVFHEGVEYRPKTDGTRNPAFDRFIVTVSPKFDEVLPFIPNPASPYKSVAGTKLWRVHASHNRAQDRDFWLHAWRYGLREVVINDHETQWREGGESFTFRTRTDPTKGGDAAQLDYSRFLRDRLGFVYGPYNNYTDFAPVNEFWTPDLVGRLPDGNFQTSWMRTYGPKPYYVIDFCAKLAPELAKKFYFNTAYCDVHTSVAPWNRTDYDARVPDAGKFAATFYAYGKVLLFQKKAWNGPVYSEGPNHYFYAGLSDGNYAQDQGFKLDENPWLVDFDLCRIHDLECDFGMGSLGMYSPGQTREERLFYIPHQDEPGEAGRDLLVDRYLAATAAFGHIGFLVLDYAFTPPKAFGLAYGAPGTLHFEDGIRVGMRSYFMNQQLAARYTQASVKSIQYVAADGTLQTTSGAIASGALKRSQPVVHYADGTVVVANGSKTEWLKAEIDGRKLEIAPGGFTGWTADGQIFVESNERDGRRFSYTESPAYIYFDSRDGSQICAKAQGEGAAVCRTLKDGDYGKDSGARYEFIFLPGASVGFRVSVTTATAIDFGGRPLGPARISQRDGFTYIEPVPGAFSYVAF